MHIGVAASTSSFSLVTKMGSITSFFFAVSQFEEITGMAEYTLKAMVIKHTVASRQNIP